MAAARRAVLTAHLARAWLAGPAPARAAAVGTGLSRRTLATEAATPSASPMAGTVRVAPAGRAPRQGAVSDTDLQHALEATAARLNVRLSNPQLLVQAITHVSYSHGKTADNSRLSLLGTENLVRRRAGRTGEQLAKFHAFEQVYVKYPHLPVRALPAAVESFAGTDSLAAWGRTVGLQNSVRWTPATAEEGNLRGLTTVLGNAVQGLIGAIYHDQGHKAARNFVATHILSRKVDVLATLPMSRPKALLSALLARQGREAPESRVLSETGRHSNAAVFLVGVFSGSAELARATGSSIKLASTLAAKKALQAHFFQELAKGPILDEDGEIAYLEVADTSPIV